MIGLIGVWEYPLLDSDDPRLKPKYGIGIHGKLIGILPVEGATTPKMLKARSFDTSVYSFSDGNTSSKSKYSSFFTGEPIKRSGLNITCDDIEYALEGFSLSLRNVVGSHVLPYFNEYWKKESESDKKLSQFQYDCLVRPFKE